MPVPFTRASAPASEEEVAQLEGELGSRLPEQFRQFLLEHDGARPKDNSFDIPSPTENSSGVSEVLGTQQVREEAGQYGDRIPSGLIPVCLAEGGNLVLLDLTNGRVAFWDHEYENADPLTDLAPDFESFLASLEPWDPNAPMLKPGQVKSVRIRDPEAFEEVRRHTNAEHWGD